ncbi:MAG: hypothetical protein KC912_16260 [Proteobacteria bacterium]|nr:hypothetical protein [Pseudomonadota bacterium]
MIATFRSAVALTAKELQHHALALSFIGIWSVLMVPFAFVIALSSGGTSFVAAGTGLAYYYGPIAVLLIVRRLVIQEYEDGTIRFLDALPAPAWLQFLVKAGVGWIASVGLAWLIAVPLLLFASMREFVTVVWFLQLMFAIALYISAWLALTFAVAHTGRFRHWIWMVVFLLMGSFLESDWQTWTWHAALGGGADATRHAAPWLGFAVTAGWAVATGLIALFLATFRGGSLPAAAFKSASTRERVNGASLVLALYLVVEVLPEAGPGTLNGHDTLPQASPLVHHAGDVGAWPSATRSALHDLEQLATLDPPTRVVLYADYDRPDPDAPGPRVRWKLWDRDEVLVRVRSEPTVADAARVIDAVLEQRSAGLATLAADRGFAADGLGLFVVEPANDRALAERRAALAVRQGLTAVDLEDWEAIRGRFGADIAAGVGAIGLTVLEGDALGPWLETHLLRVLPESGLASARLGRVNDIAGLTSEQHREAWWAALEAAADRRQEEISVIPEWSGEVALSEESWSNLDLAWWVEDISAYDVELVARPTDPVRGRPMTLEPTYRALVMPLLGSPTGETPTWFGAGDRVWVHLRTWEPLIGGWVTTPRTVVNP